MSPMLKESAVEIAIELIRLDGDTQPRAKINQETVSDYAGIWQSANGSYPFDEPCEVFHDGSHYWCADGFHRILGGLQAKKKKVECVVHKGTARDAMLYAAKCNSSHGLRRSAADKRHIVTKFLKDAEWSQKSNRWVAEVCDVSHVFVGTVRSELEAKSGGNVSNRQTNVRETESSVKGKDGKTYKTNGKKESEKTEPGKYTPRHSASVEDDTHKCPNCGCTWWLPVKFGHNCDKCNQPLGEPIGDPDDGEVETDVGDVEQKEISKSAEGDLKKARAALGVLVRFCDAMKLSDRAKPHLEGLAKLIGK